MNSRYKCHYLNISNASKPTEMEIEDQIDVGLGKVMFSAERKGMGMRQNFRHSFGGELRGSG